MNIYPKALEKKLWNFWKTLIKQDRRQLTVNAGRRKSDKLVHNLKIEQISVFRNSDM